MHPKIANQPEVRITSNYNLKHAIALYNIELKDCIAFVEACFFCQLQTKTKASETCFIGPKRTEPSGPWQQESERKWLKVINQAQRTSPAHLAQTHSCCHNVHPKMNIEMDTRA